MAIAALPDAFVVKVRVRERERNPVFWDKSLGYLTPVYSGVSMEQIAYTQTESRL